MAKVIVQYLVTAIMEETLDRAEIDFNPILSNIEGAVISNMYGEQTVLTVEEFSIVRTQELDEEDDYDFEPPQY